jgi:hypothetical protein
LEGFRSRAQDREEDLECRTKRQRAAQQAIRQRLALQQFHHQERAAGVFAHLVQVAHVRMRDRRCCTRFASESLACRGIDDVPADHLDRHGPAEMSIESFVDSAHAALAQTAAQLVP